MKKLKIMINKPLYRILGLLLFSNILLGQTVSITVQPDAVLGKDATISSMNDMANYGTDETFRFSKTAGSLERAFLKFDLSSLPPGVDIVSAKLTLSSSNSMAGGNEGVMQLVGRPWDQNIVTWNNSASFQDGSMPSVVVPSLGAPDQVFTLDVKDMVQTMVNTPLVNFGWMFYLSDESSPMDQLFSIASSDNSNTTMRPKLDIVYCQHLKVKASVSPGEPGLSQSGAAFLDVQGGVPPYTYSWNNGTTAKDLQNVDPGLFYVTVTDSRPVTSLLPVPVPNMCGPISITLSPAGSQRSAQVQTNTGNPNVINSNYVSGSDLKIGVSTGGDGSTFVSRSLLAFNLDALPGNVVINSAKLYLNDDESTHASYYNLELCRTGSAWDERTTTYNNQPAYNTTNDKITVNYNGSQDQLSFDVTGQLQQSIIEGNPSAGWLLKLASEDPALSGNTASFKTAAGSYGPFIVIQLTAADFACNDLLLNWHQKDIYNQSGAVTASQKTYLDNMGRETQDLKKNATSEVFRTMKLYDSYGRLALTTLPAFTGSVLQYLNSFMRNWAGQSYTYTDFDTPATLNNPNPIITNINNTLGNYYSNSNIYDAYQATADNPYTRTEYTGEPSPKERRISSAGTAYKMGSGHESYSFSMISGDEMKYIYGAGSYKAQRTSGNKNDCASISINEDLVVIKEISISPDNLEMITYKSMDGMKLVTCYAGLNTGETCTNFTGVNSIMSYAGTKCADVALPYANNTSLYLPLPQHVPGNSGYITPASKISYTIVDLYTDTKLTDGVDYLINASTRQVTFYAGFLSLYPNRSLMLRISFAYDAAYEASLLALPLTPADAKASYNLNYARFTRNFYDLAGNLRKTVSPNGWDCFNLAPLNFAKTFDYDTYGNPVAKKTADQGLLQMVYNDDGKLRFSQNDLQKAGNKFTYYNYDQHGRLVETGESQYNNTSGSVYFSNYYSVATATTIYSGTQSSSGLINVPDGLLPADKSFTTVTSYKVPQIADDIPNTYSYYSQYRGFRTGPVNFVKNASSTIWYNYDKAGNKTASITQLTDADYVTKRGGTIDDRIKTLDLTMDYFTKLSTGSAYQKNNTGEKMIYQFNYNSNLRGTTTTLAYGTNVARTINSNFYNKLGQLSRVVVDNNYQGIDYVYRLNGDIKAINHPGLDQSLDPGHDNANYTGTSPTAVNQDLFGEILEYYNSDYVRNATNMGAGVFTTNKYDGLVYAQRFKTRKSVNTTDTHSDYINYGGGGQVQILSGTNSQQELRFDYAYDDFNQLANTTFGVYNNQNNALSTGRAEYAENGGSAGNIAYDRNGNITRLARKACSVGASVETLDDLTYTYSTGLNILGSILDAAVNSYNSTFNFKTPSTTSASFLNYNSIGQLTLSIPEGINAIAYYPNRQIKTITLSTSLNTIDYIYGADGKKLKTKYHNNSTGKNKFVWNVDPYMYEFDEANNNTFDLKEAKIKGGVIRVTSGNTISSGYPVYEMKDHLGNVRATYRGTSSTGNAINILSYNDYYAFGGKLPGRSWLAEASNYAFQGQEVAATGTLWDQFELRSYNHDLGRWFSPDPYNQFSSPYVAMGNNPVSNTDPNGGYVKFHQLIVTGYTSVPNTLGIMVTTPVYGLDRFEGEEEDKRDRANGTGAYTAERIQKRYDEELEDLRIFYGLQSGRREEPSHESIEQQNKEIANYYAHGGTPAKLVESINAQNGYINLADPKYSPRDLSAYLADVRTLNNFYTDLFKISNNLLIPVESNGMQGIPISWINSFNNVLDILETNESVYHVDRPEPPELSDFHDEEVDEDKYRREEEPTYPYKGTGVPSGRFINMTVYNLNGPYPGSNGSPSNYGNSGYPPSDRKLKNNIQLLTKASDKINLLKPSTYTFKTDEFKNMGLPEGEQIGLIAQELEAVYPQLVHTIPAQEIKDKDGQVISVIAEHKRVDYVSLVPVLIKGMQEQQQQLEEQKNLNDAQKKNLELQMDLLKAQQKQIDDLKLLLNRLDKNSGAMISPKQAAPESATLPDSKKAVAMEKK